MRLIIALALLIHLFPLRTLANESEAAIAVMMLTKECFKCDFTGANREYSNFDGISFICSNFNGISLMGSSFRDASIAGNFVDTNLQGVDFSGAVFGNFGSQQQSDGDYRYYPCKNLSLYQLKPDLKELYKQKTAYVLFDGVDLRSASLNDIAISYGNLFEVPSYLAIVDSDLTAASLRVAGDGFDYYDKVLFEGVTAINSKIALSERYGGHFVILTSDFSDSEINISGGTIEAIDAKFDNSVIENATVISPLRSSFNGATLSRVTLTGSFQGVDFSGADLSDVTFRGADIKDAIFCNTKAPDGRMMFLNCN